MVRRWGPKEGRAGPHAGAGAAFHYPLPSKAVVLHAEAAGAA